ncbi:MAG: hypothetical protein FJY20_07925 [Bacteroidetes bacterium]|nr:hypothetical protein [Bacteroidota bacterium]
MKILIFPVLLVCFMACNSTDKKTQNSSNTDTTSPPPPATNPPGVEMIPAGPDIISLGDIRLGLSYSELVKLIGEPDSKSKAIEWEADGLLHEDRTWESKGLVLNMASEINAPASLAVFSITAKAPALLKQKPVWASAAVMQKYRKLIRMILIKKKAARINSQLAPYMAVSSSLLKMIRLKPFFLAPQQNSLTPYPLSLGEGLTTLKKKNFVMPGDGQPASSEQPS